jgi:hypothetical protein
MICYKLQCAKGHGFEGWFRNIAAFDRQAKRGEISCPSCGSAKVKKAPMAPRVSKRVKSEPTETAVRQPVGNKEAVVIQREFLTLMRKIRRDVEAKAEYVGPRFAEEARKIHYEETPARGIYGEASAEEVKALDEEGIEVFPLPVLPEEQN